MLTKQTKHQTACFDFTIMPTFRVKFENSEKGKKKAVLSTVGTNFRSRNFYFKYTFNNTGLFINIFYNELYLFLLPCVTSLPELNYSTIRFLQNI